MGAMDRVLELCWKLKENYNKEWILIHKNGLDGIVRSYSTKLEIWLLKDFNVKLITYSLYKMQQMQLIAFSNQ